ncbi:MAG: TIGR01459 family HAD-type hydrolase, partial [Proteobacteria bacterium]|nr:TIGR01459 family HAD-type hydrolase [Pseudomonadota bacterium]
MHGQRVLSGIGAIAEQYDGYVFDVWGTVYDGDQVFPGVIEALHALRRLGKKVAFLSNSPQLPSVVATRLAGIGIERSCYDGIVTSGGETNSQLSRMSNPEMKQFGGRVYQTGPDRFPDTLPKDRFQEVARIDEADWILNAGPNSPPETLADYEERLTVGAARGLPMLCANPDRTVFQGAERHICAGALAERYAALGGPVHPIGKPFQAVFDRCREILEMADSAHLLMIGDNLETDILGANRAGFGALLIASGVHELADASGAVD